MKGIAISICLLLLLKDAYSLNLCGLLGMHSDDSSAFDSLLSKIPILFNLLLGVFNVNSCNKDIFVCKQVALLSACRVFEMCVV